MNTNVYKRPPMLALLIKDFRLCKPVVTAGAIALFLPAAAAFLSRIIEHGLPDSVHPNDVADFRSTIAAMFIAGLALATLTLPAVAATALARERRDRSGEFLRTLPIHRGLLIASKGIVIAAWTLLLFAAAFALAETARPAQPEYWGIEKARAGDLLVYPGLTVSLIGVACLLASFMRSETMAAAVSIGGNIALLVFLFSMREINPTTAALSAGPFMLGVACAFLAIGIASLIAGTLIALRRTSP